MYSLFFGAVGVGFDAGAFVFGDLVLVDDPFEGGAVAEAVVEGFGRDWREGEGGVYGEAELVFGEAHLVFDAVGEGEAGGFDEVEVPGFELLIAEVELGELFAGF